MDISALWSMEGLLSLVTLSAMEIVLGIDNVVFLSIITGKLPADYGEEVKQSLENVCAVLGPIRRVGQPGGGAKLRA